LIGTFKITSVQVSAVLCFLGLITSPSFAQERDELHGPRFVANSFFGLVTHGMTRGAMLAAMEDLNIRAARVDFIHAHLEPVPGIYSLEPENQIINHAAVGLAAGVDQLPILHPPPYVLPRSYSNFQDVGDRSNSLAEEYAFALATKFKGKIQNWQIGNEPNMQVWKQRYVDYLKACYRGIKRGDPNNRVVLAGFAGSEDENLEAVYRLGGKGFFDVIASHSYTRPRLPEPGGFLTRIKGLCDVMKKYGDDKPIWVTEVGWNGVEPSMLQYLRTKYPHHRDYSCSEEDQARGLARLYLISATVPRIERVYFMNLFQVARYAEHHWEDADAYIGILGPATGIGHRPKEAYFAYKTVVNMINESNYVQRLDTGPRIWALAFKRTESAMIALWSLDDNVTVTLSDASMIKSVTSMVGTPIQLSPNKLQLSGRPIYVATSPADLASLKTQIAQAQVNVHRHN